MSDTRIYNPINTEKFEGIKNTPSDEYDPLESLRDNAAIAFMQGLAVNIGRNGFSSDDLNEVALKSYEMADAMVKHRENN